MSIDSNDVLTEMSTADSNQISVTPEEQKPEFELHVSTDNMVAYLRIKSASSDQVVTTDDIHEFLTQSGIVYGICKDAIHTFCKDKKFYSELICAKGVLPVDGTDGSLVYEFDTETGLEPKEREDGTVDFRDLGLVKNISKGEELCHIIPPEPGKDGVDVYNHIVPFVSGRLPVLPVGTNTIASEDGLILTAALDGCIDFNRSAINIKDVYIVRGDVDSASGNVDAIGSVVIQGDVREGFFVKAGKDIAIRGMVEGAMIEAKGSISISSGMNGMGKGTLRAGGNIIGKYFENANLFSENDIYADILMNCRATAGGSIILKGKKASLIGGSYQAGQRIYTKNIGTSSNTTTSVSILSKELTSMLVADKPEYSIAVLENKLLEAQTAQHDFVEQFSILTKQLSHGDQNNKQRNSLLLKAAILKKGQLAEAVESIKAEIQKASEVKNNLTDYKIVGVGIIYSGTKIIIGPYNLNLNDDYSNSKFYASPENIVFAPVLPSDIA